MKAALLIVATVFAVCTPGQGQLVLNAGESYTYSSLSLPFISSGPAPCFARSSADASFSLEAGSIQAGDSFLFEFFSSGRSGSVLWQGPQSSQHVLLIDAFGIGGSVRFTGLSGSVTIDGISMENSIVGSSPIPIPDGGQCTLSSYAVTFVPVPEPCAAALTVLGMVVFWLGCWKRSNSKNEHAA